MNSEIFFKKNIELRENARANGREWLTYPEWLEWRKAAMEAGFVTPEDFKTDLNELPGYAGLPIAPGGGMRVNGTWFHVSILKTWRRVREAKERGDSAEQFHRDEVAASKARAAADKARSESFKRSAPSFDSNGPRSSFGGRNG